MKNENIILSLAGLSILAIIIYYISEKNRREEEAKKLVEQNTGLYIENSMLRSMVESLQAEVVEIIDQNDDKLGEDVKSKLKILIRQSQEVDVKIIAELNSIQKLIEIKEESKAVLGLVKIIENLLKKMYNDDEILKSKMKGKKPKLFDLINHAKSQGVLEKDEFHFLNGIREVRNKEAHVLPGEKSETFLTSSIMIGIAVIFKLFALAKSI